MKKLWILGVILCCLMGWKMAATAATIADNFEDYSVGKLLDQTVWLITEKPDTGGSIQVVEKDGNQYIENTVTYMDGYEKSDSFLQSNYTNFAQRCYISAKVQVPENVQGTFSLVLRGDGDADENTIYLASVTAQKVTYFPCADSQVSEPIEGEWIDLSVVLHQNGKMEIWRDGVKKRTIEDYKTIRNGTYQSFNIGHFALRLYSVGSRIDGNTFVARYDDVSFYSDISLEDDCFIGAPLLWYYYDGEKNAIDGIRKGVIQAQMPMDTTSGAKKEIFLAAALYEKGRLCNMRLSEGAETIFLPTENLEEGQEIKLFCLESMTSLKPLTWPIVYVKSKYTRPYSHDVEQLFQEYGMAGVHPRILATAQDFSRIRQNYLTDSQIRQWGDTVIASADSILAQDTCQYIILDNKRLLNQCRLVLTRMTALGLAYQITGDTKYTDRAWLELEAAGNFPDWNPRHYLDTAEMTAAFAIGYDWMYDVWEEEPEKRQFIEEAMYRFGVENGLKAYQGKLGSDGWYVTADHNWNSVCNGGMVMGALALADVYPQQAFEVVAKAVASLENMLPSFAPDGAWFEGPGYWQYAVQYLTMLMASLETSLGTDFAISSWEGLRDTVQFICQATGPCGTNNFHDGGSGYVKSPEMFYFAEKYQDPRMSAARLLWMKQGKTSFDPMDLIYYRGGTLDSDLDFPLSQYYRGVEMLSMRSSWTDLGGTFVSAHAGKSVVNHSHIDNGSFVFDSGGVRWALDLGSDHLTYTTHYGDMRYEVYRVRAEAHNTLVIHPDASAGHDLDAQTVVERFSGEQEDSFAIMDLSTAFKTYTNSVRRGIRMQDGKSGILIRDEIDLKHWDTVYWFMQTKANVVIHGNTATLTQNGKTMTLHFETNAPSASMTVTPSAPLATSPNPSGQQSNQGVWRIAIKLAGSGKINLSVKLSPDAQAAEDILDWTLDQWK